MSRIFVTGGAGFIGSHVCDLLVRQGHTVAIYDNFTTYVYPLNRTHIDNILARTDSFIREVKIFRGSVVDQDFLRRSIASFQPDHILHLASMPISKMATEHPEEAVDAMIKGTLNLLENAVQLPDFQRFLYISSSMVYGDFAFSPMPEDGPKQPLGLYGSMKLAGEYLCQCFARSEGLPVTIVRPSAVYGPTDNNRRVLSIFVDNALQGKPLRVCGRDEALDFSYVTDTAAGIVGALFSPTAAGRTYNITRGRARTILEAAHIVKSIVPSVEIIVQEQDQEMPSRGTLDISAAQRDFGYAPQVEIEQGIRYLYDYRLKQEFPLRAAI